MRPKHIPLKMYQGEDFDYTIVWRDETGTLVNLTGYSAKMQVRARDEDPNPLIELNTSNGRISLGGVSGYLQLHINASDTGFLASSFEYPHVYDLEATDGAGKTRKIARGPLANIRDRTR